MSSVFSHRLWLVAGLVLFATSRLVFFFTEPYMVDSAFYFEVMKRGLNGLSPYDGNGFPYPPLALAAIYLPGYFFGSTFSSFRAAFMTEMLIFDVLTLSAVLQLGRQHFRFSDRQQFLSVLTFSVLGFFMGPLLFDRIDIGVALISFLIVQVAITQRWTLLMVLSNIGFLYKLVPLIPAFYLRLQRLKKNALFTLGFLIVPSLLTLFIMSQTSSPGIFGVLEQHQMRGIQLESIWATPFMLHRAFDPSDRLTIDSNYGAQHLNSSTIPSFYIGLSKYLGIFVFLFIAWVLWRIRHFNWPKEFQLLTALLALLIFLTTQRVLSPQFFIWLMPFLAMGLVIFNRWSWWFLTFFIYFLTFYGFRFGYWNYVSFSPYFTVVMSARNLLLVILTCFVSWTWWIQMRHLTKGVRPEKRN